MFGLQVQTLLLVAAFVLSVVGVVQSNGKSPVAWAVALLALALALR